jgi:ATP-dependent Lhr-like helicase
MAVSVPSPADPRNSLSPDRPPPTPEAAARAADAALAGFHPAVAAWFRGTFASVTPAQAQAWPAIQAGRPVLVAAPTGSGKTLAAFLAAIDQLVREAIASPDGLPDATTVVYVSPLKALSNDIQVNLQAPLQGIARELERLGLPPAGIRTAVRTGDTTQQERAAMRKRPPHIIVTTPESLYVLLSSESGRAMLSTTRSVIVDEIHAVAGGKRGSHLSLTLERLAALCERAPVRIGLSATQKPLATVARFLVGQSGAAAATATAAAAATAAAGGRGDAPADVPAGDCAVIDIGHDRRRDLGIELPPVPLEAVMANDVWERVYDRMAELALQHRTTLVFVNTRRMAERAARHLAERLGAGMVAAHHGSMSKEHRLDAEQRLKRGDLQVLIATASLELGIDIGDVDLVCQVGSPRSISAFLQRVGRAGHQVGGVPKGRLFPSSRDDLIECVALLDCVRRGELDALHVPQAPLDVLAQQIVAEVSCREWSEDELYGLVRRASPYAELPRDRFDAVVRMLLEGYTGRHGVRGAYLHRDSVAGTLRGRRGSKMTAVTSGGTIPDNADYAVLLEPQGHVIGTVNEDFAVESLAGDIFQLGNTSYRILRVETGRVRVEDAHGMAPNIPFWLGEAPGRSDELSAAVARLRAQIGQRLDAAARARSRADTAAGDDKGSGPPSAVLQEVIDAIAEETGAGPEAARQVVEYLARARAALGTLPTQDTLALERFFDESGGMQLVLHAPFGSRINRAWGLALRKRFCRTFNFELQAAATEDAIVLSLSESHSFPLEEVWRYLNSHSAEHVLMQALLDAPLFNVRWRWNATTSLALPRFSGGRKVAPQLQRMRSEDLLAAVFPDQAACVENIAGERELADHPLVNQTIDDCMHEAMDADGWLDVLRRIERGEIELVSRDLPAPSPLAMEILGARPYAFLDDAPLEERRTRAVQSRRWSDPESADDLGALDPQAIESVRQEAWPQVRDADEMHEALMTMACIADEEARANEGWPTLLAGLAASGHATRMATGAGGADGLAASGHATRMAVGAAGAGGLAASGHATRMAGGAAGAGGHATGTTGGAAGGGLWVPLERLACFQAAYPAARFDPELQAPRAATLHGLADDAAAWQREDAVLAIVRARLGGFGPLALREHARLLDLPAADVAAALARLESEGVAMRGRFTPGAAEEEWCERHLLARINRYTIRRLRREIEPVSAQDFMRFLFEWQRVAPTARGRGADALAAVLDQMEGYEVAAGAWEDEILAARLRDYDPAWLDHLCRAGKTVWARMPSPGRPKTASSPGEAGAQRQVGPTLPSPGRPKTASSPGEAGAQRQVGPTLPTPGRPKSASSLGEAGAQRQVGPTLSTGRPKTASFEESDGAAAPARSGGPVRSTPIVLLPRAAVATWYRIPAFEGRPPLTSRGERAYEALARHGAMFYDELQAETRLLPSELEDTLAELVAAGLVNADSYSGLRALLIPAAKRSSNSRRRRGGGALTMQDAGRWALLRRPAAESPTPPRPARTDPAVLQHIALTLLRRYGVVFWRLLEREPRWLPAWRELLPVLHRMEARGEVRGGRYVDGLSGEQFALPEAIPLLRDMRRRPHDGTLVRVSGADPLNLCGTVLPGEKIPAIAGNRIVFRDGVPVTALIAGESRVLADLPAADLEPARSALLGAYIRDSSS